MPKTVTFTADGQRIEAVEGSSLLQALLDHGIEVPHFCYHEALGVDGNCRMCMVEIEGSKRPQIACDTPVKEGMAVRTRGENINEVKRAILELELVNHPVDCPICDQAGECKLQEYYMQVGLYESRLSTQKVHKAKHVDLGSNVMLDQERCVLCARCSRFTSTVTQTGELGIMGRGDHAYLGTMPGKKLDNPYAMNVVDLCPVGALTSKDFRFKQRVWFLESTPSVCQGCARGCNIYIDHTREKYKDASIYRFRPRLNRGINGHFICDAGRLSFHGENEGRQEETLLEGKAVDFTAGLDALKKILEAHRGDFSILLSSSTSLEDAMALKLLAKHFGGTLACDHASYIEGDDDPLLIRADKASNLAGMRLLGIDTGALEPKTLLLNVNHKNTPSHHGILAELLTHKKESPAALTLPIASYSEQPGSVINHAGYLQAMPRAVQKNSPKATIIGIVSALTDRPLDFDAVWNELAKVPALSGLGWHDIGTEGKKVDL